MAGASSFIAKLRGEDARERAGVYSELLRRVEHFEAHGDAGDGADAEERDSSLVDTAVQLAVPLCELLVSMADPREFQRAAQVLTALISVDPVRMGGETSKPGTTTL
eukprot:COSAG02_NODE_28650_length_585_cov_1.248971_1_plen_106_part_01